MSVAVSEPRLMHCWDDGDKHQALVQETLGHFQRFWPSEWPALEIQVCNSCASKPLCLSTHLSTYILYYMTTNMYISTHLCLYVYTYIYIYLAWTCVLPRPACWFLLPPVSEVMESAITLANRWSMNASKILFAAIHKQT